MSGTVELVGRLFTDSSKRLLAAVNSEGAVVVSEYLFEETKAGHIFFANIYNSSIAAAGSLDMLVSTGTIAPQLGIMVDSGAQGVINIFETVTTSNDGTQTTVYNANRTSATTALTTCYSGPTITVAGTNILINHYIAGGSGGNSQGSASTGFSGIPTFIFKASTKYVIRYTNTSVGATPASIQVGFHEDV